MSDQNGNNGNRILSLDQARKPMQKDADLITVKQARAMFVEETVKVHEYYLNQIPAFVARMIQDALVSYGLIKLTDEALAAVPAEVAQPAEQLPRNEQVDGSSPSLSSEPAP